MLSAAFFAELGRRKIAMRLDPDRGCSIGVIDWRELTEVMRVDLAEHGQELRELLRVVAPDGSWVTCSPGPLQAFIPPVDDTDDLGLPT